MKIAVYQGSGSSDGAPESNIASLEVRAAEASADGAALLMAPEMFLTGYNIGATAIDASAEPADGPMATAVAAVAQAHDIAILYGYPERAHGQVYNAARLLDRHGSAVLNYRKTHLFGDLDKQAFAAGDHDSPVVEIDGMRLGVLICYDVEFPENVRKLALAGADLIAVPTALMEPYDFIVRSLVNTRAYENQVFLAYANRCGSEGKLTYLGQSCIVGPDGRDLARAGADSQTISATLDPELLARSRRLNTYQVDRRPALYGPLTDIPDTDTPDT